MLSIKELTGETQQSTARGSAIGSSSVAYALSPIVFLKEIVDAANRKRYFEQFAYITNLPMGTKDVVIPKRKICLYDPIAASGVTFTGSTEPTTADITFTAIDNYDGLTLTPLMDAAGVSITNHAIRTNSIDLVKAAQEELITALGDKVDYTCATTLGAATAATTSARGAQTVYGGDAQADSGLAAGDTLTTDMIAEAKRKLQSTKCYWWSLSGAEALSSQVKNPWTNDPAEPFVLFIGPEQEEVLLTDSQFVNASEYGNNEVVMNGEIGKYLGIKIIVTPNIYTKTAAGTAGPDTTINVVAMTRCLMIKSRKALAIAYGQEPKIYVFDYPSRLQQRIIIETSYAMGILHADAVVFIDVADA